MRWYAKLPNGDIEAMTLDELDVAFGNGVINTSTLVLAPEATSWHELGELAGLGESPTRTESRAIGSAAGDDVDAQIPAPAARRRSKWAAPLVFATVIAGAFAAAAVEAQQAGAFSRRHEPSQEAASPSHAPATTAAGPSAVAAQAPNVRPVPPATVRRPKSNLAGAAGTAAPSSEPPRAFTSGGDRYDPLNADLP